MMKRRDILKAVLALGVTAPAVHANSEDDMDVELDLSKREWRKILDDDAAFHVLFKDGTKRP